MKQHAHIAAEICSRRDPDVSRVARHLADVAAIRLSPVIEGVNANVLPVIAVIRATNPPGAGNAKHLARLQPADQHAVGVDHIVVEILAVTEVLPVLTAVHRAQHAPDFHRAVDDIGVGRTAAEHQHPLGRVGTTRHSDFREAHTD